MPFNVNTYKDVMTKADECWLSHKQETPTVAAIKAENAAALADSNDLENPAVAAIKAARLDDVYDAAKDYDVIGVDEGQFVSETQIELAQTFF